MRPRIEPRVARALVGLVAFILAAPAVEAQFIPYYGRNKVTYDNLTWRVYKSPHFEIYYYPEFEQHLARVASYAESAYQRVSSELKHEISKPIPLILYKTHSEFEQTNLFPSFLPEQVAAFAEPVRGRMVLPIDEPPDQLQGLITHELTHIFEFDIIPRGLVQRGVPLWLDEGLADYMRGIWEPLDLMSIRDAAVTDQIPRITRFQDYGQVTNPRLVYNLGHAVFEFIESRFGKEGIRQFLYTFRKSFVGGGNGDIYNQAFRMKPDEFDDAFDKWMKERFKGFRDKERPSDYGRDIAPDSERTSYTQVFAFSPSPSGEILAAVTGNRAEGEADVVLLSAKDGAVIKNLTSGFTGAFESLSLNEDFTAGRSLSFDPSGDTVAFFGRKGKGRALFLVSVLSGRIVRRIPVDLDLPQSPCLLPDGRHVLFAGLKEGVADIYLMDLENGSTRNLTEDPFHDSNPQISPDGSLVAYTRRISGHEKIYILPLGDPSRKTQVTFGAHDDVAPGFSPDGNALFYASTENDDIYNIRSIDLRTGAIKQYTDVLGGNMAPAVLKRKEGDRVAFISYFKGEYRLQTLEPAKIETAKEIEQDVELAQDDAVDFVPDVVHQVVAENKRRKGTFEKLFLEGRPPLNVGLTSSGDLFGGSQLALTDVLGDHTFTLTAASLRDFRSYQTSYVNLSRRLHYGLSAFDFTQFFYAAPYGLNQGFYSRAGAFATQRFTGALAVATYPLSRDHRLEVSAGVIRVRERFENADAELAVREAAAAMGVEVFLNNGTVTPLRAALVGETTRFREFGPLSGHTYSLGMEYAPPVAGTLERWTLDGDMRHYQRVGSTSMVLAGRLRGFYSSGDRPDVFFFGGNMELRGFPYLAFAGNQGFFANLEVRFPVIDVMRTPLGLLGPIRGTLYAGLGGAKFKGEQFTLASSDQGVSYVRDPTFGEPVSGFHLVDGRASYGLGLQFFFLGYPLHFDWTRLSDLKVSSSTRFDFWIGFDF